MSTNERSLILSFIDQTPPILAAENIVILQLCTAAFYIGRTILKERRFCGRVEGGELHRVSFPRASAVAMVDQALCTMLDANFLDDGTLMLLSLLLSLLPTFRTFFQESR